MAEIGREKGIEKVESEIDEIGTVLGGGVIQGVEVEVGIAKIVMEKNAVGDIVAVLAQESMVMVLKMVPVMMRRRRKRKRKRRKRRRRMMERTTQIQKLRKQTSLGHLWV